MTARGRRMPIGAEPIAGGVDFRVWAPTANRVDVVVYGPDAEAVHPLERTRDGRFGAVVPATSAGTRYRYRIEGGESYPDPASRGQPDGVHGPSEVVDPDAFPWTDGDWSGIDLETLVVYELHVGTFTPGGTFESAAERLPDLAALGVTAVEVMPIAGFPGKRNWGYDGVNMFAPAAPYGGPDGFKGFVDAAHAAGLGVILDVVYNHLGPEGNYLPAVTGGRIFTERHHTPWGAAINFDDADAAGVRELVVANAVYWCDEYHVDGLRLDATHAILDESGRHILAEIAEAVHALSPRRLVIAEDERNDPRLVRAAADAGYGLDAVWADDFHHQVRRLTAGDHEGYFAAYEGTVDAIVRTLAYGWWRRPDAASSGSSHPDGSHAADRRPDGDLGDGVEHDTRGDDVDPASAAARALDPFRFVHCIQNHDQVGNRAMGERLNHQVEPAVYRAASALLLISPYTPLLWMGQEWAASTPFLYFTDHPPELGRLVTEGRRAEFGGFADFSDPDARARIPDPQAPRTFERSRLDWPEREAPGHAGVLELYTELLRLRRTDPALRSGTRDRFSVAALGEGSLALRRWDGDETLLLVVNFRGETRVELDDREETRRRDGRTWGFELATEERRFGGTGSWGRLEPDGTLHLPAPGAVLLRAIRS